MGKATEAPKPYFLESDELPSVMSKAEVAAYFRISESSLNAMIKEGFIKPIPKVPGVRFSTEQVMELKASGTPSEWDVNPFTPRERAKMKATIKAQEKEIEKLRRVIQDIVGPALEYINRSVGGKANG